MREDAQVPIERSARKRCVSGVSGDVMSRVRCSADDAAVRSVD